MGILLDDYLKTAVNERRLGARIGSRYDIRRHSSKRSPTKNTLAC